MIGLEPHLILRTRRANEVEDNKAQDVNDDSFGYVGNILFDRMVGATIHTCTPGEYGRLGSPALVQSLCDDLESSSCNAGEEEIQKKVYQIPVGGSNGLGSKSTK
jgi:D-cysteine desulfhydrase